MNRADRRRLSRETGEMVVESIDVPTPACDCPPVFMVLRCGTFVPVSVDSRAPAPSH